LRLQIATPLRNIGGQQMPALETYLQQFQAALDQNSFPLPMLRESRKQTDAVLVAMKAVLDRMLELESYNELLELLRGILAEQQRLSDETKAQQRQRLRGLLED
jgi:vacuolar-type H+-ATPase subunit D/Vma8